MSRHTTQTRTGYVHQLCVLGLGLGLAASLTVSSGARAASDEYSDFVEAARRYAAHLAELSAESMPKNGEFLSRWPADFQPGDWTAEEFGEFYSMDGRVLDQLNEIHAYSKMVEAATKIAIDRIAATKAITTSGDAAQNSGRKLAIQQIRQSAVNAATAAHTITITIINSIAKIATAIPIWIDPTVVAPGYYETIPQNQYGAIVSGNAGYSNALVIELAPGNGGHGSDYGADYGYGWDAGLGGDYYSDESLPTSSSSGSGSGASADDDAGLCPTEAGEYSFETIEDACDCPEVDYWYTEDDSGTCDELFSGAQSCVPPWRDWYTLVELEDGRQIGVPDMLYMIPADDIRSELFDALPTVLALMEDGGIITMHYAEAWTIGQNVVSGAPITSPLQLQTAALDGVDQALGLDGVLVGYACSANPAALGGTMAPALLEGQIGLMDADGIVEDGASVQAAIIGAAAQ